MFFLVGQTLDASLCSVPSATVSQYLLYLRRQITLLSTEGSAVTLTQTLSDSDMASFSVRCKGAKSHERQTDLRISGHQLCYPDFSQSLLGR